MVNYQNVKKYFNSANGKLLREIDSQYGYFLYAYYILEQIQPKQDAKVLELGCGDGKVMNMIHEIRPDISFHGIDISFTLLKEAKKINPYANFLCCNVWDGISFKCKFNNIYSFSFAQYFPHEDFVDINKVLFSCLKRGGRLVHCSIPDYRKKFATIINGQISRFFLLYALIRSIGIYLLQMGSKRYSKDGISVWHNPEKIQRDLTNYMPVKIKRPSDSWYRFDLFMERNE